MAAKDIIKLRIRRGTNAQRKLVILEEGEPGFTTDTQRLYIGTGGTNRGGLIAGNIVHPIQSAAGGKSSGTVANRAVKGDLVYEKNKLFQLTQDNAQSDGSWTFVGTNLGTNNTWLSYNTNNELTFNDSAISINVDQAIVDNFNNTSWVLDNMCPALTIATNNPNSCGAFGSKINQITANANDIDDIENSITSIKGFTGYVDPTGGLPAGWGSLKAKIADISTDLGDVGTGWTGATNVVDKIDLLDATIALLDGNNNNNNQALTQLINDTTSNTAAVDALNTYTSGSDPLPAIPNNWGSLREKIVDVENSITNILGVIYPVGAIYLTATNINPGNWIPNTTWVSEANGKFLAGQGSNTDLNGDNRTFLTNDNNAGLFGTYNHTLEVSQMPAHSHGINPPTIAGTQQDGSGFGAGGGGDVTNLSISNAGGGGSHNNTPPGFAVYVWKRTA